MDFIKNALGFNTPSSHVLPAVITPEGKFWLDIIAHVQNVGDVHVVHGQHLIAHPGLRVEGVQICNTIPDVDIKYMGHIEGQGDTHWVSQGEFVGTRGLSRRLEGIAVRLEGKAADQYDVKYYVHMRGKESSPVASNGQFAGTRGESRQVEGVAIWLEPKNAGIFTSTSAPTEAAPYVPTPVPASAPAPTFVPYASYNIPIETFQAAPSVSHSATPNGDNIDSMFDHHSRNPGDIHEHMPTLYRYAKECNVIGEFGVRSVVSTWAFIRGLRDNGNDDKKKLVCCDLERSSNIDAARIAAEKIDINFEFIAANDLQVDLKEKGGVDMLFIDTWHVYPQLIRELNMHSPNVRKYIAMHDTTVDGIHGESVRMGWNTAAQAQESGFPEQDIRQGLGRAVKEFLETHSDWRSREVYTNCNGLTVLERVAPTPSAPPQ